MQLSFIPVAGSSSSSNCALHPLEEMPLVLVLSAPCAGKFWQSIANASAVTQQPDCLLGMSKILFSNLTLNNTTGDTMRMLLQFTLSSSSAMCSL